MKVGEVQEIWRYPVKSMRGERLDACVVTRGGIPGDRGWALRDERAREIRGAKYMPKLMQCEARYREEPLGASIPHVDITLPDSTHTSSDDEKVAIRLSEALGREVSLWPLRPASDRAHYKRARMGSSVMSRLSRAQFLKPYLRDFIRYAGLDAPAREMFAREPHEPLPDFSIIPSELFEYTSPPGTYFDAFPLHLLTTSSLTEMARLNPSAAWDARRFRPNFLIKTVEGIDGLVEAGWSGRALRIGEAELKCEIPAVRCGMTTHAQADLPKDPSVLRSIVRDAEQNLGVYASIVSEGRVSVGDRVKLD